MLWQYFSLVWAEFCSWKWLLAFLEKSHLPVWNVKRNSAGVAFWNIMKGYTQERGHLPVPNQLSLKEHERMEKTYLPVWNVKRNLAGEALWKIMKGCTQERGHLPVPNQLSLKEHEFLPMSSITTWTLKVATFYNKLQPLILYVMARREATCLFQINSLWKSMKEFRKVICLFEMWKEIQLEWHFERS